MNEKIWMGRKSKINYDAMEAAGAHAELAEQYAGEFLTLVSIEVAVLSPRATVRHADGNEWRIPMYPGAIKLFKQAGYTMPTKKGIHATNATVTCQWTRFDGVYHLEIVTVEPKPMMAIVPYVAPQFVHPTIAALRAIVDTYDIGIETIDHTNATQRSRANAVHFAKQGLTSSSISKAAQWLTIANGYLHTIETAQENAA